MPKVDSKSRFKLLVKTEGPAKIKKISVDSLAKFMHCSRKTAARMKKKYMAKYARAVKISSNAVYNEAEVRPTK